MIGGTEKLEPPPRSVIGWRAPLTSLSTGIKLMSRARVLEKRELAVASASENPMNPTSDVFGINKQYTNEFAKAQAAWLEGLQDINLRWLERWQAEAQLLSDFGAKLSAARSFTDTAAAYGDFSQKQWQMASEDTARMIADTEAFVRRGADLFSNGWLKAAA